MSALGHKRTFAVQNAMSALAPKADIATIFEELCAYCPKDRLLAVWPPESY
jgi:hypothetical protein